jgi:hemerythrin
MANGTWPGAALRELLEQHAELRRMVAECEDLIDRLDEGVDVSAALGHVVAKLRVAFEAHNKHEESLLRPVLIAADAFGPVRVDQMIDEHVREHRAVRATLDDLSADTLQQTLRALITHLEAEERYFLSSKVLHDDLIIVEGGG